VEDLGHAVVCKHGDFVNVVELAVRGAVKGGPEVGDEDLGALEETHALALKGALVAEAGEGRGERVDEARGGLRGGGYEGGDAAGVFLGKGG
jgi:hypothetical protein